MPPGKITIRLLMVIYNQMLTYLQKYTLDTSDITVDRQTRVLKLLS